VLDAQLGERVADRVDHGAERRRRPAFAAAAQAQRMGGRGHLADLRGECGEHVGAGLVRWPVAMFLGLAAISLVYRLAPAANQRWAWVTPGSAFAVGAWAIMSVALRFYVGYFANYNATYGSIGGVILLMPWLYLSGVVLLVGTAVNSEIERATSATRQAQEACETEGGSGMSAA
jgi:membrane protein